MLIPGGEIWFVGTAERQKIKAAMGWPLEA